MKSISEIQFSRLYKICPASLAKSYPFLNKGLPQAIV